MMQEISYYVRYKRKLYALVGMAIAGVILSAYLTYHFYLLRSGFAGFHSFCNVSQAMNCDVVASSRFAELMNGLPLSSFTAGWYLSQVLVLILAFSPQWKKETNRALLGMTGVSLLFSLIYFLIMAAYLKTFCLLCLGIDAINIAAFILALTLKPEGFGKPSSANAPSVNTSQWKTMIIGILVCIAVTVAGLSAFNHIPVTSAQTTEMANTILATAPISISSEPSNPSIGPESAPVRIVEFSDYQCPMCRITAEWLHVIYNRYPGKIRIEFRNFPLDPTCNPEMRNPGHSAACEAAKVAYCSHQQGKFEEVFQGLFENQPFIAPGKPTEIAKGLGADAAKLQACVTSSETAQIILRDIQLAVKLGVNATPALYVNGHKLEQPIPVEAWIKVVDRILAGQSTSVAQ